VRRTSARLIDLAFALGLTLALSGAPRLHAAEWPNVPRSDTLWPGAPLDDPQWPKIPPSALGTIPTVPATAPAPEQASAPAKSAQDAPAKTAGAPSRDDALITGASLDLPALKALPVKAPEPARFGWPPEFAFEGGLRYWYSVGQNRFAFANGVSGNPSSTLDWDRMTGHSGEIFGRIDHRPTHVFVKGVLGAGILKGGDMDDLDFLGNQTSFSNTTSAVDGNNISYGIIDIGYSFDVPSAGVRYGAFVGYHYWREKMTAFGILCNADGFGNRFCPAGATAVPFSTPVDVFDTTWNALRIGGDVRYRLYDHWTVSGELAFVPYARLSNDDSHLLRSDLGPVPNIVSTAWAAMGGEAEAFVRYRVGPHFELGVGARYWGIFTDKGAVQFGPTFSPDLSLTKFSTQRYGVLLQAKATF